MNAPTVPETTPQQIARDTFLIPNLTAQGPDAYLYVNSIVIRGAEPVVVDTGAPVHREQWLEKVFSVVDPADVRWIFLSHDDGDHTGGLHDILEAAPNARLVTNFFSYERLALDAPPLPLERMLWVEPGESFDAGDRRLHLFRPPIFDGPTTRGLYDDRTGVMWAVDSFAAFTSGAVYDVDDIPAAMYSETFPLLNSMVSPWHEWIDPVRYDAHVDTVEALKPLTIASAHGPVLTGTAIHDAFDRVRGLAGQPRIVGPGQSLLDELLAAATGSAEVAA
jgi:flavorubredoxin